jgi:hypothetical protein
MVLNFRDMFMTNDFSPSVLEPYRGQHGQLLTTGDYDAITFKLFEDSLNAVSIGAGVQAPALAVVSLPWPIAYVAPASSEFLANLKNVIHGQRDLTVVVAAELLRSNLGANEVEAMMADMLAKTIAHPTGKDQSWEYLNKQIPHSIQVTVSKKLGHNLAVATILNQDAWSAHLVNQPDALRSAIVKTRAVLEGHSVKARFPMKQVFVEPPHENHYGFMTRLLFNRFWAFFQRNPEDDQTPAIYREFVLDVRIMALEELEARPVTE